MPGLNRLYLQGSGGAPTDDGTWPLLLDRRLVVEGDHFIMNQGSFVDFSLPISTPLTGEMTVHVARDDDPGVVAEYAVFLVRDGVETPLGALEDEGPGNKGRTPFSGSIQAAATEPTSCDDRLLLRLSNETGGTLGIVIVPPDYMSWIDLFVPPQG